MGEKVVHGEVGSSQSSTDDIDSTCIELRLARSLAKALQVEETTFSTDAACKQRAGTANVNLDVYVWQTT